MGSLEYSQYSRGHEFYVPIMINSYDTQLNSWLSEYSEITSRYRGLKNVENR